jgi:hypothetical protein
MAFTHLIYDSCAYKNDLAQEVGTFAYMVDDCRYVHKNPARIEFGIVGGNDVSIVGSGKGRNGASSMVDLESDLKGQTRLASRCPTLYYQNPCPKGDMATCQPQQVVIRGNPANMGRVIDTTLYHLPPAQIARYVPIQVDPYMGGRMPRC